MREPYRSEFVDLIAAGAGTLDIPAANTETAYTKAIRAPERIIRREVERVDLHINSLNVILERYVGSVERVLDVGCGTGATTVAMALSSELGARELIGLDPNEHSLAAARVRAKGYELGERCRFQAIVPGARLAFEDESFDLTTCVSVIEYVHANEARQALVADLTRVTKPGGHILLITPSPFRLRAYHTHRILGDWRRDEGYPWSSPPWQLERMFPECDIIPLRAHQFRHGLSKRGVSVAEALPEPLCALMGWSLPWLKILARKR